MQPFVIDYRTAVAQTMVALPEPFHWICLCQVFQLIYEPLIVLSGPICHSAAACSEQATRLAGVAGAFLAHLFYDAPLLARLQSFFSMMYLAVSSSMARLAYILFKRAFSSSNSLIRFSSEASIPP